jgi:predicted ArsR family transcriptional regulator
MIAKLKEQNAKEVYAATNFRANFYCELLKWLKQEFGDDKARNVFWQIAYNTGKMAAERMGGVALPMEQFKDVFISVQPADGVLNEPEIISWDENELRAKLHKCPMKDSWRGFGLSREEVKELCEVADGWDHGFFGAMYDFSSKLWDENEDDSCLLCMKKKQ